MRNRLHQGRARTGAPARDLIAQGDKEQSAEAVREAVMARSRGEQRLTSPAQRSAPQVSPDEASGRARRDEVGRADSGSSTALVRPSRQWHTSQHANACWLLVFPAVQSNQE
jgi:hypothetical protein